MATMLSFWEEDEETPTVQIPEALRPGRKGQHAQLEYNKAGLGDGGIPAPGARGIRKPKRADIRKLDHEQKVQEVRHRAYKALRLEQNYIGFRIEHFGEVERSWERGDPINIKRNGTLGRMYELKQQLFAKLWEPNVARIAAMSDEELINLRFCRKEDLLNRTLFYVREPGEDDEI